MNSIIFNRIKNIPELPGIYLMLNKNDEIIYVGKAKNLKKRVASYFNKNHKDLKTSLLITKISKIDFIVTDTEKEAFILEDSYIKQNKPKFNIRLRDDKRYPYLKITLSEKYPRLVLSRTITSLDDKYYGPFPSNGAVHKLIGLLNSIFKLRRCKNINIKKNKKVCLYNDINQCAGVCSGKISSEEYRKNFDKVINVLDGHTKDLIEKYKLQMNLYSANLNFEKAAEIRDKIFALDELNDFQKISLKKAENFDVIGYSLKNKLSCLVKFIYRNGKLISNEYHFAVVPDNVNKLKDVNVENLLKQYIMSVYEYSMFIPPEIIIPNTFNDMDFVQEFLSFVRKLKVKITVPSKGKKKKYINLVNKNAEMLLHKEILRLQQQQDVLVDFQNQIGLDKIPVLIEAFDISNIKGQNAVGSMVVCREGIMSKKEYRKFKIKTVEGINDYDMMSEVLMRRYSKLEKNKYPDLIIIDGGRQHLNVGLKVLKLLELEIPVISIAKREEEIFSYKAPSESIRLKRDSNVLKLIQVIRDESHRFAISYHRLLRDKNMTLSVLDSMKGIGLNKKMTLLNKFKTVDNIKFASIEDLKKVEGIGTDLAKIIYEKFH